MGMPATHRLTLPGAMLQRGFWLYVWRIQSPQGEHLYVGRTGDSSSPFAIPPVQRMGQHLGHNKNQNALRRQLSNRGIALEECRELELIAHGPLFEEAKCMETHRAPRNVVAALEKALADALKAAGYDVLNSVSCRMPLDEGLFEAVQGAFAVHFPALCSGEPVKQEHSSSAVGDLKSFVVSSARPPIALVLQRLLGEPLVPVAELRTQIACHSQSLRQSSSAIEFIDLTKASSVASICLALLATVTEETPTDERRLIQAGVRYFLEDDDAESDLSSPIGFDDDAEVIALIARAIGRSDLLEQIRDGER